VTELLSNSLSALALCLAALVSGVAAYWWGRAVSLWINGR
jgi:hypothetical protein